MKLTPYLIENVSLVVLEKNKSAVDALMYVKNDI